MKYFACHSTSCKWIRLGGSNTLAGYEGEWKNKEETHGKKEIFLEEMKHFVQTKGEVET